MDQVRGKDYPLVIKEPSYNIKDNSNYSDLFTIEQSDENKEEQVKKIERRDTYGLF